MPSRRGTGEGGPAQGSVGQTWGWPCLTPSWPVHPPRRWFSIQNSQLVYQKKLKVRFGAAGAGSVTAGSTPRPPGPWGGLGRGGRTGLRTLSLNGQRAETTWISDGLCL